MTASNGTNRGYVDLDASTAPKEARAMLEATRAHFGFLPSAMARMALVPALPRIFQTALRAFDGTSFTPIERETIVLTMARHLGCDVCLALHGRTLEALGGEILLTQLSSGEPLEDQKLAALVAMTLSTLERHGDVDDLAWGRFIEAGYTRAHALELVLGVGTYTLSIYANRLTAARVDDELVGVGVAERA